MVKPLFTQAGTEECYQVSLKRLNSTLFEAWILYWPQICEDCGWERLLCVACWLTPLDSTCRQPDPPQLSGNMIEETQGQMFEKQLPAVHDSRTNVPNAPVHISLTTLPMTTKKTQRSTYFTPLAVQEKIFPAHKNPKRNHEQDRPMRFAAVLWSCSIVKQRIQETRQARSYRRMQESGLYFSA